MKTMYTHLTLRGELSNYYNTIRAIAPPPPRRRLGPCTNLIQSAKTNVNGENGMRGREGEKVYADNMAILTYTYRAQHQEGTEEGCFTHKCFNRYLLLLNYGISFKHCAVTHSTKKRPLVRSLGAPAHRGNVIRTS